MTLRTACRWFGPALCGILLSHAAWAGPPSDTLLPKTTVGYVSIAKPDDFQDRWHKTQFGQMLDDELMKPFVDDLREQVEDKYRALEDKLGVTLDDLDGVPGGELSLSLLERKDGDAALAITIDITGKAKQGDELLAAIEKRFAARGGEMESSDISGGRMFTFTVPRDNASPQTTVYFLKDNLLCGVDDRQEADALLKRFAGNAKDNLRAVASYEAVMQKCRKEAGQLEPELRWYVEPFGFLEAVRTLDKKERPRRTELDYVKILQEQGFDALQGAGGFVNQLVEGDIELLHRTVIYAPPTQPGDPLRWTKSMRMLQLPNIASFEPQSWVPRMSAQYTTVNLSIKDAFNNIGPLFDAVKEHDGAWENSLKGWKNDPYGPRVDVQKEFVENLGNRITIVADYSTPITTESEHAIFAIEATNEKELSEALAKWMSREPDVVKRELGQVVVWERVPPDQALEDPDVEVPLGFESLDGGEEEATETKESEPVLPSSAITVAMGHLMMASDIEYLQEILEGFGQRERLASSADYQQMLASLAKLSPGDHSALHFGRLDEEMRPTFELVRQGKMPESKTMFGKFLNNLLTTEEQRQEGELREQKIDGSKLPSFEAVRRYFGPHGRLTRSDDDGWLITGAVLNKEAP